MTLVFDKQTDINAFRAIVLANAMEFYLSTGMKVNTAYTPKNMLATTEQITGRKYGRWTRSNALDAIADLRAWVEQARQAR